MPFFSLGSSDSIHNICSYSIPGGIQNNSSFGNNPKAHTLSMYRRENRLSLAWHQHNIPESCSCWAGVNSQQRHLEVAACPDACVTHEQDAAISPTKNGLPIVLVEKQVLHSPFWSTYMVHHSLNAPRSKAAEIPKGCT